MKIIFRGVNKKIFIGNCNSCKSMAEAKESELKNIQYDPREHNKFSWEMCPVCKAGHPITGYGGMLFREKTENR